MLLRMHHSITRHRKNSSQERVMHVGRPGLRIVIWATKEKVGGSKTRWDGSACMELNVTPWPERPQRL